MSVCLRCDWRGDATPAATCPRCGEPLFRAEPPRTRPAAADAPPAGAVAGRPAPVADASPADPAAGRTVPPPERSDRSRVRPRRTRVAAAVLPLALVAAVIVVGTAATSGPADPTPDEGAEGTPSVSMAPFLPPLTGSIVYSRRSPSADRVQLWIWDLERGDVNAGSVLPRPLEIVGASVAGRGRVGVTWRRGDGVLQAAVVDPSDVEAEPELIVEGDLVSWSARGSRVTAATLTRGAPCPQRVTIDAVRLQPDVRLVEAPSELRTCGDVLGLETDGAVSYFTYRSGRRLHVAYPGVRRPTIVLRDHELLSASWAGDMIVRPIGRRREGALAYFNRKTTDPSAAPVAFNADATFAFGGVLAWAPNSFEALVLGVSSGRPSPTPGIYALDTLPTDGIDPPRWVMEASGPTSATFTRDGVAIVATGGDVFAVHDGGVSPMALPVGAPLLDGRIAWIP